MREFAGGIDPAPDWYEVVAMSEMDDDSIVRALRMAGKPVTRENYIKTNWAGIMPDEWTAEDEAELPEELQDHERFPQLKP